VTASEPTWDYGAMVSCHHDKEHHGTPPRRPRCRCRGTRSGRREESQRDGQAVSGRDRGAAPAGSGVQSQSGQNHQRRQEAARAPRKVIIQMPRTVVLQLTYMKTIGVRELQQHASSALRRVERGETLGVTDRGRLVAVLTPPSAATGAGALIASGRVQPARRSPSDLPEPVTVTEATGDVLDDLRSER